MNLKSQHYQVAYRKRTGAIDEFPLKNNSAPFELLKNTWRYWAADPFLFENNGETFIFCELYDFVLRRGVIGYSKWEKDRFTKWKPILVEPFHMSYPLIFRHKDSIYMLPETYQSGELRLYRATEFPEKWEYCKTLEKDCSLVDTTIAKHVAGNGYIGYTLSTTDRTVWKLMLDDDLNLIEFVRIADVQEQTQRNGGNMITGDGKLVRPCQDCKEAYGQNLIFRIMDPHTLEEMSEYCVKHDEIYVCDHHGKKAKTYGMHTYNRVSNFEVVDIKLKLSAHVTEIFFRVINKVIKRT